jgi:hypothetical protein
LNVVSGAAALSASSSLMAERITRALMGRRARSCCSARQDFEDPWRSRSASLSAHGDAACGVSFPLPVSIRTGTAERCLSERTAAAPA